jgi:hypothetical protein
LLYSPDFKSHTGVELATAFAAVLEEFKLTEKILAVTCDNASNNDVMIKELAEFVPGFEGEVGHTRCFLHVVNLVAKSLIHQFDVHGSQAEVDEQQPEVTDEADTEGTPADDTTDSDESEEDTTADDNDGFVDEVEELGESEKELHIHTIRPVKAVLVKVSTLADVTYLGPDS